MLSTGIPELRDEKDLAYLQKAFALHLSESEAAKEIVNLLHQALNTKSKQIDDMIHGMKHK
jgi:hypothetical protein